MGHLPTRGFHLSVLPLFAFSYCTWGSQGKNAEVVCHSILPLQEKKGMTDDEIVEWHHPLNGHEFEQTLEDSEGQGSTPVGAVW